MFYQIKSKFFAHISVQSSLYSDPTALFSCPYFLSLPFLLWSFYPFPFYQDYFSTHTHNFSLAGLLAFSWIIPCFFSSVPLPQARQTVSSTGYHITLMMATLGSMHFSFHSVNFSGILLLPQIYISSNTNGVRIQNKYLFTIYCLHWKLCELNR